ncbi:MAG: stalk domain-containing protein, partial [Clostridiaceae bacterium]|nr:stalk domain-containing protein [Clostridiaceae bacterium]
SFRVNDKISGQEFYKILLEILGYKQDIDFIYARTLEFADRIGLVEDAGEIAAIKSFTVNDVAKGIYRALNTNVAGTDKKLVDLLVSKGVFRPEKVEAAGFNSLIQITPRVDLKSGVAMVPIKDTYTKMGGYILENDSTNMAYEIKKGSSWVRLTERFTTAYINRIRVTMEEPVMKDKAGVYYVPVSFILECAGEFGYDAEYIKAKNILRLEKLPEIKAVQSEMVLTRGDKRSIKIEKKYSEIEREDITSKCTFAATSNGGTLQLGSISGEVTGRTVGSAEIAVRYEGKEIDRVTVHVVDVVPKYYPAAFYEQVFETSFRLNKPNFIDGFGAVWNKKSGVVAEINENDYVDTGSSLKILNYSSVNSGVTVDLTKLLENRAIKGKTITLKIYAKGMIEDSKLYAVANIKSKSANIKKENSVTLDEDKWKSIELLKLDIPAKVQELTLDIATEHNGEIMIDAFTMTSN